MQILHACFPNITNQENFWIGEGSMILIENVCDGVLQRCKPSVFTKFLSDEKIYSLKRIVKNGAKA